MQIELAGTQIILLPQKAIFLPVESILVLGDLHLGKAMHFRKAGIFMPAESASKDYITLHELMLRYKPQQVYFLGDLFHSDYNTEWKQFIKFIDSYPDIRFSLIKGNHDILDKELYKQSNIDVIKEFHLNQLVFSHDPLDTIDSDKINIAGHIHPGCLLRGLGRQHLRLPCFYFKDALLLLPAFGQLTGLQILEDKGATVFAVLPDKVVLL